MEAPARLAVFADARSWASIALTQAAGAAARRRDDVELAAVVDSSRREARVRGARARGLAVSTVRRAFGEGRGAPAVPSLATICRRLRVPLHVPPGRDVNAPELADALRRDGIAYALSLHCPQVFGAALLGTFRRAVNYHNGLLPAYGGMRATAWSVYHGERESGFTFHLMTADVDAGPVLLDGRVDVAPAARAVDVELAKTERAAAEIPRVLELLLGGNGGAPQTGTPRLFALSDARRLRDVGDPTGLTWEELMRRLRAFEVLSLELDGGRYDVTRLAAVDGRPRRPGLAFRTADGVLAEPTRFLHLPFMLYRAYRLVGGRRT